MRSRVARGEGHSFFAAALRGFQRFLGTGLRPITGGSRTSMPTMPATKPRILIANGFNRFHLAYLAAGLRKREWDVELITGAYPSGTAAAILRRTLGGGLGKFGRLQDRQVEIEPERVHSDFASELLQKAGQAIRSKGVVKLGEAIDVAGFRLAGFRAARSLRRMRNLRVYHFRAGFGLASLEASRRRGIPTICDHSIVHPAVMKPLLQNGGRFPTGGTLARPHGIWRLMLNDIERADWIVVNSDFVRETFEWAGFDMSRVKVIYLGVEPDFISSIPERAAETNNGPLRLLFAGEIGQRKGVDILFRALSRLSHVDWKLDLIGVITPTIASSWSKFLNDPRVTWHGVVRSREVAALMSQAAVFVFPTLAEGSARVIAEAMAAGCYVVTTHNSGSVVKEHVHGRLVPAGDDEALATTLEEVADQRSLLPLVGRANAEFIRRDYLVEHYTERVISFYHDVLHSTNRSSLLERDT